MSGVLLEVVRDIERALAGLADCADVPDSELADALVALERISRRVLGMSLLLTKQADRVNLAEDLGLPNTLEVLRVLLRIGAAEAKSRLGVACKVAPRTSLLGEVLPPELPAAAQVARDGLVGLAHLQILAKTHAEIDNRGVGVEQVAEYDQDLAGHATQLEPHQLEKAAAAMMAGLADDGQEPAPESPTRRGVWFRPRLDGSTMMRAELTPECAETIRKALASLATPTSGRTGSLWDVDSDQQEQFAPEVDQRTLPEREHDALLELGRLYLDRDGLGDMGGQAPHVGVNLQWDLLAAAVGQNPIVGAMLDHGATIGPDTARYLACDARILPAVMDGHGAVLDVGRAQRLSTRAIRAALAVRDKGCSYPGCDRPPAMTQAHHVAHWADGGVTSVTNMTLLCGHHHRRVHKQGYTITMRDNRPVFHPPQRLQGYLPAGSNPIRYPTRH